MSDTGLRQYGITDLPGANSRLKVQSQDIADASLPGQRKVNQRHLYIEPKQTPVAMIKGATGAAASGSTGAVNLLSFGGQGTLECAQLGAGQTLVVPTIASDGLEISGDQTDDEGRELCSGLLVRNQGVFLVGTDAAFFFRCRGVIDDVSGTDTLVIGFRLNQAYQTGFASYTDFAALNLDAGQWKSVTNLNNGGVTTTTLTGSTVADLGAFEVKILVSAAGVVTYQLGTPGSLSTNTVAPAFTFDTGDTVTPFLFFLHSADLANSVRLRQWEAGFQAGSE